MGNVAEKKLKVFLFGQFRTQCELNTFNGLDTSKVQELLCFLLLNRNRQHSRETLSELFWHTSSTAKARAYLRKALWQLQKSLGFLGETGLCVNNEYVQLIPCEQLWADIDIFEKTFVLVKSVPSKELGQNQITQLEQAINLYQGNILEGWYQEWCLVERGRFSHMYLSMLDRLIDYSEDKQAYETGITYGMQALKHDVAHERTHNKLMRLYYLAGDRTTALRQYELCCEILRDEFKVQPGPATRVLYNKIVNGNSINDSNTRNSNPITSAPQKTLDYLKDLQQHINSLQMQLCESIKGLEDNFPNQDISSF